MHRAKNELSQQGQQQIEAAGTASVIHSSNKRSCSWKRSSYSNRSDKYCYAQTRGKSSSGSSINTSLLRRRKHQTKLWNILKRWEDSGTGTDSTAFTRPGRKVLLIADAIFWLLLEIGQSSPLWPIDIWHRMLNQNIWHFLSITFLMDQT